MSICHLPIMSTGGWDFVGVFPRLSHKSTVNPYPPHKLMEKKITFSQGYILDSCL